MAGLTGEAAKLQQHLELLREQHIKLQQRYGELEQKYTRTLASSGETGPDHFVSRLVKLASDLFDKPLYSDIQIVLADRKISAHRFVLAARSSHWEPTDNLLTSTAQIDLSHMMPYVATALMKWVYTNAINMPADQDAVIELLAASNVYRLSELKLKCEQALITSVNVRNCIKLYQTSEEHNAEQLKKYCLQIISSHWTSLNTNDFASLSAPLLYDMFKAHTPFPLHLAIQHLREDVVFLFLIEYSAQLPHKLNECDEEGNIPLNLALLHRHEGIANTLVSNKCSLDVQDREGNSLLHLAVMRGDSFAASFLIKHGASTLLARRVTQETVLHLVASYAPHKAVVNNVLVAGRGDLRPVHSMASVAKLLLEFHTNPDAQDSAGYTPLQRAVEAKNEEVFAVLINHVSLNLELRNTAGNTALKLALQQLDSGYPECEDVSAYNVTFAARLIKRGSSPDATDPVTSNTLLHWASSEPNEAAAIFLVHHGASVNHTNHLGETPIHVAASRGLHRLVSVLLQHGADPNVQTAPKARSVKPASSVAAPTSARSFGTIQEGEEPSGYAYRGGMSMMDSAGLNAALLDLNLTSLPAAFGNRSTSFTGSKKGTGIMGSSVDGGSDTSSARGSPRTTERPERAGTNPFSSDSGEEEDGGSRIPKAAPQRGYPLTTHTVGSEALSPLQSLPVNLAQQRRTSKKDSSIPPYLIEHQSVSAFGPDACEYLEEPEVFDVTEDPGKRTALHLAIACKHPAVVDILLQLHNGASSGRLQIGLNISITDANADTPLGLALWTKQFTVAKQLLATGADIETFDEQGRTLLHLAIVRRLPEVCLFLLDNGANFKKVSSSTDSLLLAAIRHQLSPVVDKMCDIGIDVKVADDRGNTALWIALRSRQEAVAKKLISHGCDPNALYKSTDGSTNTLLHRAIFLKDTPTAIFLIKSGADVNVSTLPVSRDMPSQPPLHMACERGMLEVVQALVEFHANVNGKDSAGRSALHVAISFKQRKCSSVLLNNPSIDLTIRDKSENTPFAASLATKDNEIGEAIIRREPKAAEQLDSKGRNFLHLAVLAEDVESVIFLLSVKAEVNSKIQDGTLLTPLHLAVRAGCEIIVRHLLLAGACVSDVDNHAHGALHMAVEKDCPTILSVLLEHGADPDQMDEDGCNPLHLAMQQGHLGCVKVLIEESSILLTSVNARGETCLHVLAKNARENAGAIFNLLLDVAPNFPINKQDGEGNTALLLAYIAGSTVMCDALIRAGAHPGVYNKHGQTIFNVYVATKHLLFRVLDQIAAEPEWLDGNFCQNCNMKFTIAHRKHHCRHCGRLLCKQCTVNQVSILKFDLTKPVKVCEICSDSFVLGSSR